VGADTEKEAVSVWVGVLTVAVPSMGSTDSTVLASAEDEAGDEEENVDEDWDG
jgi:hypothetical protein